MSVHSEYSRALEALLSCLEAIDGAEAVIWSDDLRNARSGRNPDLSTAAKAALHVLDAIDQARGLLASRGIGPDADAVRAPSEHLRAHCVSVLGAVVASGEN
jgi:hypothetical protein